MGNEPREENALVGLVLARVGGATIFEKDRLWPGRPWLAVDSGAATTKDGFE